MCGLKKICYDVTNERVGVLHNIVSCFKGTTNNV